VSGLRREQSEARSEVLFIDTDDDGRTKYNPLADWSWNDVWHYIDRHHVPYNPLHDAFFPSIGCEPCTRAVALGEDSRAGRWWWEQDDTKECGLHVSHHDSKAAVA
jgi:phosphoadenosine phosphosulfate reductase